MAACAKCRALDAARAIRTATGAPLFHSTVSRLLVELNRPLGHPQIFSAYTQRLAAAERDRLLHRYYFPYWRSVEARVRKGMTARERVLHLSVHSYTAKLRGVRRTTDIGLLYDPTRPLETRFCRIWRAALLRRAPQLRVQAVQQAVPRQVSQPGRRAAKAARPALRRHPGRGQPAVSAPRQRALAAPAGSARCQLPACSSDV
jgi:predicted N-formylglutamate amidohydrolase